MFNGYKLKSCREGSAIYTNINDPRFQISVFTALFNNSKPVHYSVVKNYYFYTHNLSGPARIRYQIINNKHRIFSEQYLKNEKIKDTINSILILNKLSN